MLRRLITLFALLSGLAAIGAPVQARVHDVPGIGMVAAAELNARRGKRGRRAAGRSCPADCRLPPCEAIGPKPAPAVAYSPAGHAPGRPRARIARSDSIPDLTAAARFSRPQDIFQICRTTPMIGAIAKAIFGSSNDRYVKSLDKTIQTIAALEEQIEALSDEELRAQTQKFREQLDERQDARRHPARSLRHRARSLEARARHAPLRRADGRRHRAPPRRDRRDAHRRGQDPGGDARHLPQRDRRQGRPRRHRQRLPRHARRRVDGADLQVPRPDGRRDRAQPVRAASGAKPMPPTSPTAPTTNSASTTCATT